MLQGKLYIIFLSIDILINIINWIKAIKANKIIQYNYEIKKNYIYKMQVTGIIIMA